jgi:Flp pilus assembly protein TadG
MPACRAAAHRGRCRDRGAVTVELAVLFPVLLALLLSGVQAAMWWHARNLALAAAQAGLDAGRAAAGTPAQAAEAAAWFARRAGGGVSDVRVSTAGTTAVTVRVQVGLTAPRVLPIPGLALHLTQTAIGGRERFTTPGDQP